MKAWLGKFKFVTHLAAVAVAGGATWIVEHPEIITSVVKAYPKAAALTTAATLILAIFHTPQK